jgi:hypothetical protein
MELKPYQQQVINDLSLFLEHGQETKDVKEHLTTIGRNIPQHHLHLSRKLLLSLIKTMFPVFLIFA